MGKWLEDRLVFLAVRVVWFVLALILVAVGALSATGFVGRFTGDRYNPLAYDHLFSRPTLAILFIVATVVAIFGPLLRRSEAPLETIREESTYAPWTDPHALPRETPQDRDA